MGPIFSFHSNNTLQVHTERLNFGFGKTSQYNVVSHTKISPSSIKVLTITGMIILGIIVDLGGGPDHDRIGFRYWKNPGPFVNYHGFTGAKGHFLGTASVATQAAFSYIGTEAVAVRNFSLLFLFTCPHPIRLGGSC
jgi:hypothetical protein